MESSSTRDWTRVPSIGRQILYHQTTSDISCFLSLENDMQNIHVGVNMLSWQYSEIYTCIPAYLWTYSVKGNLWWCLHGSWNLSFCFSITSHSNGKIPGFHHLSCIEFSACPIWLLKKTVILSYKGGCACIPPVSWVCFCRIVYYQYTLRGQVSISIFTNYEWACLL